MAATRVPVSGLTTTAPADEARLPPDGGGPQREVGLLAVREVPLVEQADLHEELAAGQHQRAVGMSGRLPPLRHRRRARGCRRSTGRRPAWRRRRSRRWPARRAAGRRRRSSMRARQSGAGSASWGARPTQATSSGSGWSSTWRNPALAPGPNPRLRGSATSGTSSGRPAFSTREPARAASRCRRRPPAPRPGRRARGTGRRSPTQRSARFQWTITTGSTRSSWPMAPPVGHGGGMDTPRGLEAARDLLAFIDASPSPFHACATAAERLEAAGFDELDETAAWPSEPGRRFVRRGGSLVAWATGRPPRPDRPVPDRRRPHRQPEPAGEAATPTPGTLGYRQLAVEVYGGALLNSWLDRDLGLSGRVVVRGRRRHGRAAPPDRPSAPPRAAAGHPPRPATSASGGSS